RTADSTTAPGSPAMVTTERLWSASIDKSSRRTPSTRMAATIAWTQRTSAPSEKLGTHSTSGSLMVAPPQRQETAGGSARLFPKCVAHLHLDAGVYAGILIA